MGIPGTIEHKKALQKSANIKIGLALLMIFGSAALMVALAQGQTGPSMDMPVILLLIVRFAALVPWFWGLAEYAKSKGYSGGTAAWGLLGCIGLLVLAVMPDKYQQTHAQVQYGPTNYPRTPGAPPEA